MHTEYVRDRIENASKPLSDVIPKANLKLNTFSNRPPPDLKNGADKLGSAKVNTTLVTKLFISLQARPDVDIDEFFKHENQREPPSLSDRGKLRSGTKSDILVCLPNMTDPGCSLYTVTLTRL